MNPAIQLEQVAKGYRLYRRPGDRLRELFTRRRLHTMHWALQAVDLQIQPGETFGIIGENGAGKSTLLKLVAGTSKTTHGQVLCQGRITALLELGAGFHPEETGRENVYLMGALNGIKPKGMAEYFDEIAAFSELSPEVLERPVKTYSSGMFMRLAFSAATAVDPDILIVDEALSVGDMYFQKKSLDRIMRFRELGKTVMFCSHNMYQIRSLCQRAAWLHEGRLQELGETEQVVTAYESHERAKQAEFRQHTGAVAGQLASQLASQYRPVSTGFAPVKIRQVSLQGGHGDELIYVETFQPLAIAVELESLQADARYHVGIAIVRNDKENVFGTSTHFESGAQTLQGNTKVLLHLPELSLLSGEYRLSVYVLDDSGLQVYDMAELICPFTVHNPGRTFGFVHMPYRWEL